MCELFSVWRVYPSGITIPDLPAFLVVLVPFVESILMVCACLAIREYTDFRGELQ